MEALIGKWYCILGGILGVGIVWSVLMYLMGMKFLKKYFVDKSDVKGRIIKNGRDNIS